MASRRSGVRDLPPTYGVDRHPDGIGKTRLYGGRMVSRADACALFGADSLDSDELPDLLGITLSNEDCSALEATGLKSWMLHGARGTHILLPVLSYTIRDLREIFPELQGAGFVACEREEFALLERMERGWCLIPYLRGAGTGSAPEAIVSFLFSKGPRSPTVVEAVWAAMLWATARGELLFRNIYVRTSNVSSSGHVAKVGFVPFPLTRGSKFRFQLDITLGI
jgi:hypothetical protein